MNSAELVSYLREHLEMGYAIDEIKLHLVSYGVSTMAINSAVEQVQEEILSRMPGPSLPSDNSTAHIWLLMPAVLFVIVFGTLMIAALL